MSDRVDIITALVTALKGINGTGIYTSNVYKNVRSGMIFQGKFSDYPFICVYGTEETREYLPSKFRWGFLKAKITIYVKHANDPTLMLDDLLVDIEKCLEVNSDLSYGNGRKVEDILIRKIQTDQGLLAPIGIGELDIEIRYQLTSTCGLQ